MLVKNQIIVTFTSFTSINPLSKSFRISDSGSINKTPAAQMTEGLATLITIDFADFAARLSSANELTAFGYGLFDQIKFGKSVMLTVKNRAKPEKSLIARTKEYFSYPPQSGIIMIDYDPSSAGQRIKSPAEMMEILCLITETFKNVAYCSRGSLSSGVHKIDESPKSAGGFHLYIPVSDASDIPRFGKALFQRLFIAGHGHIDLASNGAMLVRSIIDAAVFSPERLDFVGPPIISDDLEWTPPKPFYCAGEFLDTHALIDLDVSDSEQFEALVRELKAAKLPESKTVRERWGKAKIREMVSRGVAEDDAIAQIDSMTTDLKIVLPPDYLLTFDQLGVHSVSEVLKNSAQFDGKALSDPIEGQTYGKTTAKFWANESTGTPFISSMAHGGIGYSLSSKMSNENHPPSKALTKVDIFINGGDLGEIVDQCERVLLATGGYYQRGPFIVRIIHSYGRSGNKSSPTSLIAQVDALHLTEAIMRGANIWQKRGKNQKSVQIDLPTKYANTLLARQSWKLPYLAGIIYAPTLRSDGTIFDKQGYDESSGLFFDAGNTPFLPVPENPSHLDALNAIEKLKAPLKEFKFKEESDLSTAIAAFLTGLIRRSIDNAPLFLITAPIQGSGKGLLAEAIAQIATGRNAPSMTQASDPNEERKRLMALLIEGDPVICIDNIEKPLTSDTLCTVLTMPELKDRILGKTEMVSAPTNTLFLATGNNVQVLGDLTRRVLPCRIDPEVERPQERSFSINLPALISECRPELVQAGLTILRAYHVAGRPVQDLTAFGSFEQWSQWVRCALVWLNMSDPNNGLRRIEQDDPVRRELAFVLEAWYSKFESLSVTVSQVIKAANEPETETSILREALIEIAPAKEGINPRSLGRWISKYVNRIESGYCFQAMPASGTRSRYRVKKIED